MSDSKADPNTPETEEDGYRAEAIRRQKVRKMFEKKTLRPMTLPKVNKTISNLK